MEAFGPDDKTIEWLRPGWPSIYLSMSPIVLSRISVYRLLLGDTQQGRGGEFNGQVYLENHV